MMTELITRDEFYSKIDLFENHDKIPKTLQGILEKYNDLDDYVSLSNLLKETKEIGYTFDYYLDGVPYHLRPISMNEQLQLEASIEKKEKSGKIDVTEEMIEARSRELNEQYIEALKNSNEKLADELLNEKDFLNSYYKGQEYIDQVFIINREIVTEIGNRLNALLQGKEDFFLDLSSADGKNVLSWALQGLEDQSLYDKLSNYFNTAFRQEVESWDMNKETSTEFQEWKAEYDDLREDLLHELKKTTFIPTPQNVYYRIISDKWAMESHKKTPLSSGMNNDKVQELQSNYYSLSRSISLKEGVYESRSIPQYNNHLYEKIFIIFKNDEQLRRLLEGLKSSTLDIHFKNSLQLTTNISSLSSALNLYFEVKGDSMWDFTTKIGSNILKFVLEHINNPVIETVKEYFNLYPPLHPSLRDERIADEQEYVEINSTSNYVKDFEKYELSLQKITSRLEQDNISIKKLNSLNVIDQSHADSFIILTKVLQNNINSLNHLQIMEPNQQSTANKNELAIGKLASLSRPDFFFKGQIMDFDSGSVTIKNLQGDTEKFPKKDIYLFFPGQKYDRREIEDLFIHAPGKLDFSKISKEDLTKLMRGELTTSIFEGRSIKEGVEKEYQYKIRPEFNSENKKLELKPYFKYEQQIAWDERTVFGQLLKPEQVSKLVEGKAIILDIENDKKDYSVKVHYDSDINQIIFDNFVNKSEKSNSNKLEFKDNFAYEEFLRNEVSMYENASKINIHQFNKALLLLDISELNEFLTDFSLENSQIDLLVSVPNNLRGNEPIEKLKAEILETINSSSEKVDLFKEKFKGFSVKEETKSNVNKL